MLPGQLKRSFGVLEIHNGDGVTTASEKQEARRGVEEVTVEFQNLEKYMYGVDISIIRRFRQLSAIEW